MKNKTSFQHGESHPRWKGGKSLSYKGYVRINIGANRDRLEHNVVIEGMLSNPISYMFTTDGKIPKGMDVHHIDHNKQHNCPGNLMLLDRKLHGSISSSYRDYLANNFDKYVAWMKYQEEVPF